jgi:hypothetical protein
MRLVRRGRRAAHTFVPLSFFSAGKSTLTAFEICLRDCASFPEKLRQLLGKWSAKRAPAGALFFGSRYAAFAAKF